jgi:Ca2+-binding RTX toxin-like protein
MSSGVALSTLLGSKPRSSHLGVAMRPRHLLASLPLAAALLLYPATAAQAQAVIPADCAVPPDIDLTQFNVVIGTDRSEKLVGTEGPDFICGRLGNDVIFGKGGDDLILSDTTTFFGNVSAAGGNDIVFAGAGNDQVLPGPGNDAVDGDGGDDFLASRSAMTSETAARARTPLSADLVGTSSTAGPVRTCSPVGSTTM